MTNVCGILSLCAICTSIQGGRPVEMTEEVRSRLIGFGDEGGSKKSPVDMVDMVAVDVGPMLELTRERINGNGKW
jgi:hypothetical protein